ncbi:related to methyltransferase [Phialocephala subalpina]|uniref:Related to methyltransferase n=1 Tax=Phialocephala subalpina TaxID=576137 RepID=A0A1L7XMP5_9HELO|nr:related to methyltransferase [Phialocephala subalpina]
MALSKPDQPPLEAEQAGSVHSALSTAGLSVDTDISGSDNDSAIGSTDGYSSTQSVRSSIYDFVEENGRTYHRFREGKYYLPNDEREQDRLDLQHHLFLLTLSGELYAAPIHDIPGGLHNVLDIATGTGIWAIDFANQFPSAQVTGTDLSPVQPAFVPPNCQFEVDDSEDVWNFSQQFDYVHGRALLTCFKSHLPVIKSAFDSLRPGGYLELQDAIFSARCVDDSMKGTDLERWCGLVLKATEALGKNWNRASEYRTYLVETGFEDVVEKKFVWPIGTWARGKRMKMLGLWCREDLLSALEGISLAVLTRGLGMSKEEVEVLLVGVRNDIKSNEIHAYLAIRVVYGRKPMVMTS